MGGCEISQFLHDLRRHCPGLFLLGRAMICYIRVFLPGAETFCQGALACVLKASRLGFAGFQECSGTWMLGEIVGAFT